MGVFLGSLSLKMCQLVSYGKGTAMLFIDLCDWSGSMCFGSFSLAISARAQGQITFSRAEVHTQRRIMVRAQVHLQQVSTYTGARRLSHK